jgi:hypothetical protein
VSHAEVTSYLHVNKLHFLKIYRHYALSGKQHYGQQRGATNGDFRNFHICRVLSPSDVLIGVGFAHRGEYVHVVSVYTVQCNLK